MHIKMIVTDLDGTLLRDDKTISDYTAEVFSRLRDKGIIVMFATGRAAMNTAESAKMIMPHGIISSNGASITVMGNSIFKQPMKYDAVKVIVNELCELDGIKLLIDYGDYFLTNHADYQAQFNIAHCDAVKDNPNGVMKISIETADNSSLSNIDFAALGCYCHGFADEVLYNIMATGVSKLAAVKIAAAHFNIDITKIAAFGDDQNDIEMLRGCGIGVAMENAIDEAKAAADYICGSNENDGVAKWLEKHLLQAQELAISPSESH